MESKKSWKSFRYQTQAAWKQARRIKASAAGKPDLEISGGLEISRSGLPAAGVQR